MIANNFGGGKLFFFGDNCFVFDEVSGRPGAHFGQIGGEKGYLTLGFGVDFAANQGIEAF